MGRPASNVTKVARAKPETTSIRTTIPSHIADRLGLDVGDEIYWDIDKIDDKWVATISRKGA